VLADVSGTFLDDSGAPLPMPMTRQVVGISADGLRAIPRVIAIANGKEKAAAVRVAVRAGYIKMLVTTSSLADELLEMG
jgi:DNA-binding transcriptional regulator LsrR (DeoR family)